MICKIVNTDCLVTHPRFDSHILSQLGHYELHITYDANSNTENRIVSVMKHRKRGFGGATPKKRKKGKESKGRKEEREAMKEGREERQKGRRKK